MKQVLYAMQFRGKAAPKQGSPSVIKAATSAPGCNISSSIGDGGLAGVIEPIAGGQASFESEVTLLGETSFNETGSISFGNSSNTLRFTTVREGYLGKSPDPSLQQGSVMWRVEGGQGQFADATGLITSNFTLSAAGEVIDHHFGVIFVK